MMGNLFKDIGTLLNLAWPVVISRVGILALSVTDTIMVGQYASNHLAYLGIGLVPHNIAIVIMMGLLLGTPVLVSQYFGADEPKKAGAIWLMSLPWALMLGLIGFVFCAFGETMLVLSGQSAELSARGGHVSLIAGLSLPIAALQMTTSFFLEGIRNPRPVMVFMIIANVLNIFANYVLVYGVYGFPELGAIGSIWATFIIRIAQLAMLLAYIFLLFDYKAYGVDWRAAKQWLRKWGSTRTYRHVGYASGISIGLENLAFNILTLFAGLLGVIATAAFTVTITAYVMCYMAMLGLAVATSVSVGNAYGAGDMRMVRRWAWIGLGIIACTSLPIMALAYGYAAEIASLFSSDPKVIVMAATMLAYASLALVFDGGQSCLSLSLRARGDTWVPSGIHAFIYIVVMLPVAYVMIFTFERGILGLVDAFYAGTALPFVAMLWRYLMLNRNTATRFDAAL